MSAPSAASRSAMLRPIRFAAPVTSATCPSNGFAAIRYLLVPFLDARQSENILYIIPSLRAITSRCVGPHRRIARQPGGVARETIALDASLPAARVRWRTRFRAEARLERARKSLVVARAVSRERSARRPRDGKPRLRKGRRLYGRTVPRIWIAARRRRRVSPADRLQRRAHR